MYHIFHFLQRASTRQCTTTFAAHIHLCTTELYIDKLQLNTLSDPFAQNLAQNHCLHDSPGEGQKPVWPRSAILKMDGDVRPTRRDHPNKVAAHRVVEPCTHHDAGDARLRIQLLDHFGAVMRSKPPDRHVLQCLRDVADHPRQTTDQQNHRFHPVLHANYVCDRSEEHTSELQSLAYLV